MRSRPQALDMSSGARLEAWLWTGPLGHLLGVTLDFTLALGRYLLARRLSGLRARRLSGLSRRWRRQRQS